MYERGELRIPETPEEAQELSTDELRELVRICETALHPPRTIRLPVMESELSPERREAIAERSRKLSRRARSLGTVNPAARLPKVR